MLCKSYAKYSHNSNIFFFPWSTGIITDEMEKDGDFVIRLNASQKNIIKTFRRIKETCIKNNVQRIIIHHNAPVLLLYIPFLKISVPGIKVYMYAHSAAEDMFWISNHRKYLYYKPIVKWAAKCADGIIAISKYVKSTVLSEMGVSEDKITVIYNGVDLKKYDRKDKEKTSANKSAEKLPLSKNAEGIDEIFAGGGYRLIYVGRLIPEKGVQVILQGLAMLPQSLEYTFVIVGDGPYRQELDHLAEELGIQNHVVFLGERRDVPELLMGADIFIHMPVWEEGFGITVIEAMAAGLVCICAKSGAIPEIISDGENGFITDKGSPKSLAENLVRLRSYDMSAIRTVRSNAEKRASDFSIEIYTKALDGLMNNDTCFIHSTLF